jgi:myo-inositol-1(or 4)-monophosphatase
MQPSVNIAIRAMRQAREHMQLTLNQYDILTPDSSQYGDVLNYVHKDAYKILFDGIKKAFPTHFVTDTPSAPADKEDSWHFLGIHAPENLLRKDLASAFSLVHRHKGKAQDALVINILSGDEYTASRGKGAALNDRRARCTGLAKMEFSLCATNPGTDPATRSRGVSLFAEMSRLAKDVRVGACNVLDLVMLASGRDPYRR